MKINISKHRVERGSKRKCIVMLDASGDYDEHSRELGRSVEQLLTPLTCRKRKFENRNFAIDNGAFAMFYPRKFMNLLKRNRCAMPLCRWVAVPDVVGSARRTLEVFWFWKEMIKEWPLAYVCQDGQENFEIPWSSINAIFIGGSDEFKDGPVAAQCIKAAHALGKWIHVGRVNSPERISYFDKLGIDSCDGSGLARYSKMRLSIRENDEDEYIHNNSQIKMPERGPDGLVYDNDLVPEHDYGGASDWPAEECS